MKRSDPAEQYRSAWEHGDGTPELGVFLDRRDDLSSREVLDVILVDQYQRWRLCSPRAVEEYFPWLEKFESCDSLKTELIEEECGYLEDHHGSVDFESILSRAGELSDQALSKLEKLRTTIKVDEHPSQIGRYEIVREHGRGAFGVVYLARDKQLQRDVAIKLPTQKGLDRAGGVDSFLREAQMVAQLEHPSIVPVFDVGQTGRDQCYVVSRFIDGQDLNSKKQQAWPHREAIVLVASVARALHAAHQAGLIHRDVKPANILLDKDGKPHLVDFGLAIRDQDFGTGAGFVGTPAYMSPEQARGEGHRVDARSDIYSLGVVLYELLVGRRPHRGSTSGLLNQIIRGEIHSPRQHDDSISPELDRICMKALAHRVADRYETAAEFATDLESLCAEQQSLATSTPTQDATTSACIPIVPKGLRSFDSGDARFFHDLLPGPRDRDGLPDSIRFWKHRIESKNQDSFPSGLIYGPSGCGKSSFVKAGLIPVLSDHIRVLFVDATPDSTQQRIRQGLQRISPEFAECKSLQQCLSEVRRRGLPSGQKLVIFIDQFEQWLHGAANQSELINALRQCDGEHLQTIVMVRDDFWMAATRFMRSLEVPLLEGVNSAVVDLFDLRHARRVLTAFGYAFGALDRGKLTAAAEAFVRQAVADLAENDRVICVQLALFAEMVKDRTWEPRTLKTLGGTHGIGEAFLEEKLGAGAPPRLKRYAPAAKQILTRLMPTSGTAIKAAMQPADELQSAAGLVSDDEFFNGVIRLLDTELKLVTPTDPAQLAIGAQSSSGQSSEESTSGDRSTLGDARFYQLSHDFLVPALSAWLHQARRSTLRGRTEINLETQAADWSKNPESKRLPSLMEFTSINLLTRREGWTETQKRMMSNAAWHHLKRITTAVAAILVAWLIGHEIYGRVQATAHLQRLTAARLTEVPGIIDELKPYQRWANPRLIESLMQYELERVASQPGNRNGAPQSRAEIALNMALLSEKPEQAQRLVDAMLRTNHADFVTIRQALWPHRRALTDRLWKFVVSPDGQQEGQRLQAAAALALLDPNSPNWTRHASLITDILVAVRPVFLNDWLGEFDNVGPILFESFVDVFEDVDQSDERKQAAAEAIARFAPGNPERVFELMLDANSTQFAAFEPHLIKNRDAAIAYFTQELYRDPTQWHWPNVDSRWGSVSDETSKRINECFGMLDDRFAYVVSMTYDDFESTNAELQRAGFRPVRIRPYAIRDRIQVAAIWHRDGLESKTVRGLTKQQVLDQHEELTSQQYVAEDLAGYVENGTVKFSAVWIRHSNTKRVGKTSLRIGIDDREMAEYDPRIPGPMPIRRHTFVDQNEQTKHCLILRSQTGQHDRWETLQSDSAEYIDSRFLTRMQMDVSVCRDPTRKKSEPARPIMAGLWLRGTDDVVTTHTSAVNMSTHQKAGIGFRADLDYIPFGICAADVPMDGTAWVASIWRRPAKSWHSKNMFLSQRANAAIALLLLGQDDVFDQLKLIPDPTLRTFLTDRLAGGVVSTDRLLARMSIEKNVSVRRALLLILAARSGSVLGSTRLRTIRLAAKLYEHDPDSGIHSAAMRLLQQYDSAKLVDLIDERLRSNHKLEAMQNWQYTANDHVLTLLDAGEFMMGYRPNDRYRNSAARIHRRIINRRFGIATTETTVEQWAQFVKERPSLRGQEGEFGVPYRGPQNYISFFMVADYCNWLSRRAGISKDQWCYEPNDDGQYAEGMTIPADAVERTGFRLPTEAEWEYACRAGTDSMFYFGEASELLPDYAWYSRNSDLRLHPVASLRPNDFGMFDMIGNGLEQTQSLFLYHYDRSDKKPMAESIVDTSEEIVVNNSTEFSARGSGILYEDNTATSARRIHRLASSRSRVGAFRVARTMPVE